MQMIETIHIRNSQQECMHQVPMVRNETHRPLVLAAFVPKVVLRPQGELIASIKGDIERWSTIQHGVLQVGGLRIPPPISQRQDGYDQRGGHGHRSTSESYVFRGRSSSRR